MASSTSEDQRIRSYLTSQAHKLSIPELVEKVRRDVLPLQEAAANVPPDRFYERPGAGDWSAAEVLTHILEMNDQGARAIAGILDRGTLPPPVDDVMTGETRAGMRTAADFWRIYLDRREQILTRVAQAAGDEHPEVKITHRQFGALSWREWLLFMRVHDLDHMRQLQAIAQHFAGAEQEGRQ